MTAVVPPAPMPADATFTPDLLRGRLTETALECQRTLAANPHDVNALLGMSLIALVSGQYEAAVQMAQAAVAEAPALGAAWVALGQSLKAVGRAVDAEHAYEGAIRLDGTDPLARLGLAELNLTAGCPEQAARECEAALRRAPGLAAAHMDLGHAMACMGRDEDALACYERALMLKPRLAEADFAVGFVLVRMGRQKDAEVRYRRAISARPDFAAAWMNLGALLREQGHEPAAQAALLRAIELRPDLIAGWLNLAALERERGRWERADRYLKRALDLNPDLAETLLVGCQLCIARGDATGAQEWIDRALAADPKHAEAINMSGILLHNEGRFGEAVAVFQQAEALGSHAATSNRGNSLLELGRDDEALRAQDEAVERDPHSAGHRYNLALTRLRLGDWERGWKDYEARWGFREINRSPRIFKQPRWQGEPLAGRRILLHAEQGLGDTIQFCRYTTMVVECGGRVVLQVQRPVARLMESLAAVRDGHAEIAVQGSALAEFDLECPLMSLPAVFGTTADTVPWTGAYLGAALGHDFSCAGVDKQIEVEAAGIRIGIAWAGNPRYKADGQRSTSLDTLVPLLRIGRVNWISLQKGGAAAQLRDLPEGVSVLDGSSRDADLADTAALIDTLDLIITTDTSIAHLAGAMGKPVWILLPHIADWRWMQSTETTPWYPTARLFRQQARGDWRELSGRVASELSLFIAATST